MDLRSGKQDAPILTALGLKHRFYSADGAKTVRWFVIVLLASFLIAPCYAASSDALKKLSVEELMNVEIEVTSVSRRPEKLWESASAIQVITNEEIRRSGATSLPEALRLASNLEVAQINSRNWAISARGLNTPTANQLLVLMDGRSLYTPRVGGVFWDVQDTLLEDIGQIEVISGPGAALWGSNAVNGVINIASKRAQETQGLLATAEGGSKLRNSGAIRYGGALGSSGFSYRVYAKHMDRDGLPDALGGNERGAWRFSQGGFRIDGSLAADDALTVQGDLYNGRFQQIASEDATASGHNILARWSRRISDDSDFKLQLVYDRAHRNTPGAIAEDLDTYDIDFQHRFPLGNRHSLVWGAGYRLYDNRLYSFGSQTYIPAEKRLTTFSGFAQDEIALIKERLNLTVGAKIEHNGKVLWTF